MDHILDAISDYYSHRIGLNPNALSRQSWGVALQERMDATGSATPEDYYNKWAASTAEVRYLLDKILVLETWFFREKDAFSFLTYYAFHTWYPKHKRRLRILSIPCSSGEEAYSIAISLLRSGFPADLFEVEGVDISQLAIAKAELGLYGKSSYRGMDPHDFAFYFDHTPEGFKIAPHVKKQVRFFCENVFDYAFLTDKLKVDVVFCRNLLIYLSSSAQKQLFAILTKILNPGGIIIVGVTEMELLRKAGFSSLDIPHVAAFAGTCPTPVKKVKEQQKPVVPVPQMTVKNVSELQEAKKLADLGKMDEAISHCLTYLQNEGPDPEGYYLLGVIMDASGKRDKAEEFFDKTLYLDPEHYEALVYKALLEEAAGRKTEAARYRERALRSSKEGASR